MSVEISGDNSPGQGCFEFGDIGDFHVRTGSDNNCKVPNRLCRTHGLF